MEAVVAKFDNTPLDKMEEKESLLLATPFGDEENGSNGNYLAFCDTDFDKEKLSFWSMETHLSNF